MTALIQHSVLGVVLTMAFTPLASAQTGGARSPGPVVTDRPDQTESSTVMAPGFVQFEAGWTFAQDDEDGIRVRSHAVPETLVRIGVTRRIEARIGFAGWRSDEVRTAGGITTARGLGDIDLGFKYQLADGNGARPEIALIGAVTVPTGEARFGSERVDPMVRLTFANELSERASVGYNIGLSWTTMTGAAGQTETIGDLLYTLVFGFGLTERIGTFAESFGMLALSDAGASQHSLDGGFTFLLRDNLQFDLSGGIALNAAADDWFVGAGATVRVPR